MGECAIVDGLRSIPVEKEGGRRGGGGGKGKKERRNRREEGEEEEEEGRITGELRIGKGLTI